MRRQLSTQARECPSSQVEVFPTLAVFIPRVARSRTMIWSVLKFMLKVDSWGSQGNGKATILPFLIILYLTSQITRLVSSSFVASNSLIEK